jgi:hypothetical protein
MEIQPHRILPLSFLQFMLKHLYTILLLSSVSLAHAQSGRTKTRYPFQQRRQVSAANLPGNSTHAKIVI